MIIYIVSPFKAHVVRALTALSVSILEVMSADFWRCEYSFTPIILDQCYLIHVQIILFYTTRNIVESIAKYQLIIISEIDL